MHTTGRGASLQSDSLAFSGRIFPVEWRVGKHSKQRGFLEALGIGTLCFTDTATGDAFKMYDFAIGSHSRKEVSITGTAESGLQVALSVYLKPQSYDQVMALLQNVRLQERPLPQEENSADVYTPGPQFIKHYSAMVASDLRPQSNLSLEDRNRFLAIMQLMLRDHTHSEPDASADAADANADTATLPFSMKEHIELLKECNVLKSEDSLVTLSNVDKLQLGILKVERKGTLSEMRELYPSAYSLSIASEGRDSQNRRAYRQMLERIVDEAKNISHFDKKEDAAAPPENSEVVRRAVQPCGIAPFSPVGICRCPPSSDATPPEPAKPAVRAPGLVKFTKRPKINAFNATVEDLPTFPQ